ncbi:MULTISPECIES: hypothetical protein [unclassified Modicisalibacter]|uniref:hypothetical protein n=1 Tax=unclassified Modicisalibacter TaxID=2679913 RepID=UPI001CD01650|nr:MULTISPECIES: hypothetical protein [unclassified Modicisalibacter]MBZ9558581.1 hypothetical protein [Modicisalibacter sp. R2A 31.J]MBZ9575527.1 hypothetical protein [Modicisalibacter sp. MOD 31.J]
MLACRGHPASFLRDWRRSFPHLILYACLLSGLLLLAGVANAAAKYDTDAHTRADAPAATHYPLQMTDLARRVVTLDHAPQLIFLDAPRHLLALAALLPDPVRRLSGWHGSLADFDPEAQARSTNAFPALARLPVATASPPA